MPTNELISQLISEAKGLDITLSEKEAELLIKYLSMVVEKNKSINLTRIIDPIDGIRRHLIDSLLFNNYITDKSPLLDIGTGAGFPGIPIALTNNIEVHLLDSVSKKIRAVEEFVSALNLDTSVQAYSDRVETFTKTHVGSYQYVTARAVASLNTLIEYATPLLKYGGRLIASKGNISDLELGNAEYAAIICGLICVSRETYELPNNSGHREFFIYEKTHKARIKLPRRVGLAKHQPLELN